MHDVRTRWPKRRVIRRVLVRDTFHGLPRCLARLPDPSLRGGRGERFVRHEARDNNVDGGDLQIELLNERGPEREKTY